MVYLPVVEDDGTHQEGTSFVSPPPVVLLNLYSEITIKKNKC
jgi:hypothetical protein